MALVTATAAVAQAPSGVRVVTLAAHGDPLPGGGTLSSAASPFVEVASDGSWLLRAAAGPTDLALIVNGAPLYRSGDLLPEPAGVPFTGDLEARVGLGGQVFFTHRATSPEPGAGLFRGSELLLEAGGTFPLAPLAGRDVVAFSLHDVDDAGNALASFWLRDSATGAVEEALVAVDSTPGGAVGSLTLAGWTGAPAMPGFAAAHDVVLGRPKVNSRGDVLWHARASGVDALMLGGLPALVEGAPSALPGVHWGNQEDWMPYDLNERGDWAAGAFLETGEYALVVNGQVVRRDGDPLPASGGQPVVHSGFEDGVFLTTNARLVWRGRWGSGAGAVDAVVLGDDVLLATGDSTDRGDVVREIRSIDVAPGGRFVRVHAVTEPLGRFAWLRLELPLGGEFGAAAANSTGGAASLHAFGSQALAAGALELDAVGLAPGAFGVVLASQTRDAGTPLPGSQGTLLLAGGVQVLAGGVQRAASDGRSTWHADLAALAGAAPGQDWHFQAWYRDAHPGPTTNLTRGVTVTLE